MSSAIINLLLKGLWQTVVMSVSSLLLGLIIGIPLGFLLYTTRQGNLLANKKFNFILSVIINFGRSVPFIILLVWMIPFTRMIVGTSIGLKAAILPLTVGCIPFIARMIENTLLELPQGLIETGKALGASNWQIISKILLPEAVPGIINASTITLITLIAYSAMAGAIGAGGLGQIGYQYGYVGYKANIMNSVIVLLALLVFLVQFLGDFLVNKFNHK
jgi:D-methionine transport system permease protein